MAGATALPRALRCTGRVAEIGAGTLYCAVLCDFNKIFGLTLPWRKVKAFRPTHRFFSVCHAAPQASAPSRQARSL